MDIDLEDPGFVERPRVLVVCEHASTRFGGEAILPWHYFRLLRLRGIDAHLICHERTRSELVELLPDEADRMHFIPESRLNLLNARMGRYLPPEIGNVTSGLASRLQNQLVAREMARRLIARHRIDVVHQPTPVSPREPSLLYDLGAPVVIGPMNGNMSYPSGLARRGMRKLIASVYTLGRRLAGPVHRMIPGKRRAAALLVANERTRLGLPRGTAGEVLTLVENGVDLGVWSPSRDHEGGDRPARFIYLGRLVDFKCVDLLLEAFAQTRAEKPPTLEIIGDGPLRPALEDRACQLGLGNRAHFAGWRPQEECARRLQEADVLVLPSIYECGGAVVLEAMACGRPVIATRWGGPADYLDDSCGILIPTDSREAIVSGLAEAIARLANDPALRDALGRAGRERAEREFDWEVKIDRILAIYRRAIVRSGAKAAGRDPVPADLVDRLFAGLAPRER